MSNILVTAGGLIFIIILSYVLKKCGVFHLEDKEFLSNVLLTVNLPCVIISGFRAFQFDVALLAAVIISIVCSLAGIALGYACTKGKARDIRFLHMMCYAGYNCSIFTIPFVTSFLSASALLGVLMFDVGNALMVFGSAAAISSALVQSERTNPLPDLIHRLTHSVPFMTHIVMLCFVCLGIHLPDAVYTITDIGAGSTAFLAMVMIGILIDLKFDRSEMKEVVTVLVARYTLTLATAVMIFCFPFPLELRKALIIAAFSPVSTASVVFMQKFGCKPSLTGVISSISLIISMVFIVSLVIFL